MVCYEKFAYTYDKLMHDMPYPMWIRFIRTCWETYGVPKTVVDLGCGTGNLTIPLARMGLDMIGIDRSADMLAVAAHKEKTKPEALSLTGSGSIRWIQQDMREWELPHKVDAVISFCDCLNYLLEEEDIEQTFRRTFQGLNDKGVYVFDVHTAFQLRSYMEAQPFILDEDDIAYIWTCDWDAKRDQITHELTIFSKLDGNAAAASGTEHFERFVETHVQRAYPLNWIRSVLHDAGFSTVECYADFRFEAPTEKTRRAFFIAVKE